MSDNLFALDVEGVNKMIQSLKMREAFELRETAMKLVALVGMSDKDTVTRTSVELQNQGEEGKIIAKALEGIFEMFE